MAEKKKPLIGLLSFRDPMNKREWSGSIFYMSEILNRKTGNVVHLVPSSPGFHVYFLKALNKISTRIFKKNYNIAHSRMHAKSSGRIFSRLAAEKRPDIIVSIASTPGTAYLKTNVPLIILDDITFSLLKKNYSNYTNLLSFSEKESEEITERAYKRADAIVFSSEWARQSAIQDNKIPPEKVHVISFGANLDKIPGRKEALNKITGKTCRILFLGVDWIRKGGNIAFEAFKILDQKGFDAEFTVCGTLPPSGCRHPRMKVIPFLDKNNPEDFKKLYTLLQETNFLLVPTRNDCTPIVFSEANSFGIPVVTTDVGGVSAVITDGVNGFLHKEDDGPEKYAASIEKAYRDRKKYQMLVRSSRDEYENRLNWESWAEAMGRLIHELVGKKTMDHRR